jgi:hypothetical protein
MRVKSALTNQATGRITLTLELDPSTARERQLCERCVVEGAMVDVVVSREAK